MRYLSTTFINTIGRRCSFFNIVFVMHVLGLMAVAAASHQKQTTFVDREVRSTLSADRVSKVAWLHFTSLAQSPSPPSKTVNTYVHPRPSRVLTNFASKISPVSVNTSNSRQQSRYADAPTVHSLSSFETSIRTDQSVQAEFSGGLTAWEGVRKRGLFDRRPINDMMGDASAEQLSQARQATHNPRDNIHSDEHIRQQAYQVIYAAMEKIQPLLATGQAFRCEWTEIQSAECSGLDPSALPAGFVEALAWIRHQYQRNVILVHMTGVIDVSLE